MAYITEPEWATNALIPPAPYITEYREHVQEIASALGCILDKNDRHWTDGMMFVEEDIPRIEVPFIEEFETASYPNAQVRYLVNLHELGHVHEGHTQGRPPFLDKRFYFENGVLKSEAQAWEFALDNCIDKPKAQTLRWCRRAFFSYISGAINAANRPARLWNGHRYYIEFVYDEITRYVVSIYERLGGDWASIEKLKHPDHGHNHMHHFNERFHMPQPWLRASHRPKVILKKANKVECRHYGIREDAYDETCDFDFIEITPEDHFRSLFKEANKVRRGRKLLRRHLNSHQWYQYKETNHFDVVVNDGTLFCVGGYYGVKEFAPNSDLPIRSYCLHFRDNQDEDGAMFVQADVMLAQKFLIETDVEKFREIANISPDRAHPDYKPQMHIVKDKEAIQWLGEPRPDEFQDDDELDRIMTAVVNEQFRSVEEARLLKGNLANVLAAYEALRAGEPIILTEPCT